MGIITERNQHPILMIRNMSINRTHGSKKSQYRGVGRKTYGNWTAQIRYNGKNVWLGTYEDEEKAAMAYDVAAYYLRCSESSLNFPGRVNSHPSFPAGCNFEQIAAAMKYAANWLSPVTGRLHTDTNNGNWMSSWSQLTLEFITSPPPFGVGPSSPAHISETLTTKE